MASVNGISQGQQAAYGQQAMQAAKKLQPAATDKPKKKEPPPSLAQAANAYAKAQLSSSPFSGAFKTNIKAVDVSFTPSLDNYA